jgi:hypothetical protein
MYEHNEAQTLYNLHYFQASYITVVMSLCSSILLVIGKCVVNPRVQQRLYFAIPFELIVVIIGTVVSYLIGSEIFEKVSKCALCQD